ncbi:MAG: DUF1343 domain-containing protein [Elusimicrobia bacterium]|nr:DUF1343 domain-containing protein [Elusimicrobiota bacterium]
MTALLPALALLLSVRVSAGPVPPRPARVLTGIDVLEADGFRELQGKRIGLVTNQAGVDRGGRWTGDVLAHAPGVRLEALFGPEHGLIEGAVVSSGAYRFPDGRTIPVYPSFHGELQPPAAALKNLDALVFDLQDVGARFYTYATTIALALPLAKARGLTVYVLDRPNPINGKTVEGPVLQPDVRSFVSYLPVPTRHGLTMGELARLADEKVGADLRVIRMRGWRRAMWFDQTGLPWIAPSPNMPDLDSAVLYPGISSLEAANVAVGRGTPTPLRWIGAPWLDAGRLVAYLRRHPLPGIAYEERTYVPTRDRWAYKGEKCPGVLVRVTDRDEARPLEVFAVLACALRDTQGGRFDLRWRRKGEDAPKNGFFLPTTRRLVGSDEFYRLYEAGAPPSRIIAFFRRDAARFRAARRRLLLYR